MAMRNLGRVIVVLVMALIVAAPYAVAVRADTAGASAAEVASVAEAASATVAASTGAQVNATGNQTLVQLYKAVNASVVEVVNLAQAGRYSSAPVEQGLGSGFVWNADGYIVTNDHVVEGADALQVIFSDGTQADATLIGTDPSSDLAVIQVDPTVTKLQPVKVADMAAVEVGQDVVAIGNPYGYQGTLTVGIVSGLGRTISSQTQYSIPNAIQTDAAINPGNSGGPLLNLAGEVIGVNDQIESTSGSNSGVGFAIPISVVQRVVPALIADGVYQHSYLGISGDAFNLNWASALGLPASAKGVYVMTVTAGGPASQAGLRGGSQNTDVLLSVSMRGASYLPSGGDLITAIDGRAVKSMDELMTYLSEQTEPGQTVALTVLRAGKSVTVNVKLGVQPAAALASAGTS